MRQKFSRAVMNNGLRHVRKKQISLKYSQSRFCRKHVILIILNWTLIVLFLLQLKTELVFRVSRNPIWAPIWSKFQNSILIKNLISWASTVHVHFQTKTGPNPTQRGTLQRSLSRTIWPFGFQRTPWSVLLWYDSFQILKKSKKNQTMVKNLRFKFYIVDSFG